MKRNRNKNLAGSKIARKMGNTWSGIECMKHAPQYVTQGEMNSYYRNFFDTSPPPSFGLLPPGLTNIQRSAPKPSMFKKPLNMRRDTFEPRVVRSTRKSRR